MSTWNMPPGVATNDIPGQDEADDIEAMCDDLRMALQDLESNGPNTRDFARATLLLGDLADMARRLNAA